MDALSVDLYDRIVPTRERAVVNSTKLSTGSQLDPPMELQLHDLSITAAGKSLLKNASETIQAGKITVIVGPSGAGKSLLLRTLAGLLSKTGDSLKWQGEIELHRHGCKPLTPIGNVGVVFQQFALFDELSCQSNVQFALDHPSKRAHGHQDRETNSRKQDPVRTRTAQQWLEELGVPQNVAVGNLSGGQKQRLAIARTLASNPSIILYDEPTSGLDSSSGSKVAELIRTTHQTQGRTSVLVTHDYPTLIPIADEVILFNAETKDLERLERDTWSKIEHRLNRLRPETEPTATNRQHPVIKILDQTLCATGGVVTAACSLPVQIIPWFPKWKWGVRFTSHYLALIAGPSAWVYLIIAGMITGFTATFFTFRFLPFRLYTQPLLIDELLASVGFALYRILVPILATILIAARCGAAVTADVGVKQYGGQTDALRTLGLKTSTYLLTPILIAFLIATPLLEWLAFEAAKLVSLLTFLHSHQEIGAHFWQQHFHSRLSGGSADLSLSEGWLWVLSKNLLCGLGTAAIAFYRGVRPKQSASDVSSTVTATVLWATLYVLSVHFVIALFEF